MASGCTSHAHAVEPGPPAANEEKFAVSTTPDRADPKWSWASPGAIAAAVVWVLGSLVFSFYTANFGTYNETYGALGAVVIVMLWLLLTVLVIILGAELNCELERQTRRDTTTGPARTIGTRGAYAADTVGPATDT